MRQRDAQGLPAAHREAGDRAVGGIGQDAVVGFDVRADVVDEVVVELSDGGRWWGHRGACRRLAGELLARMPGGHDHDHRLGLPDGDQVVENEIGPPNARPGVVAIARPVQEVEYRQLLLTGLVARGGVDVHAAVFAQGRRMVMNRGDRAVRHIGFVGKCGTGDVHDAPGIVVGLA